MGETWPISIWVNLCLMPSFILISFTVYFFCQAGQLLWQFTCESETLKDRTGHFCCTGVSSLTDSSQIHPKHKNRKMKNQMAAYHWKEGQKSSSLFIANFIRLSHLQTIMKTARWSRPHLIWKGIELDPFHLFYFSQKEMRCEMKINMPNYTSSINLVIISMINYMILHAVLIYPAS